MPTPYRVTSGVSVDSVNQPLGSIGVVNPFFYHTFSTDFDNVDSQQLTTTLLSTGTVAVNASFDGGAALFTTAATLNDTCAVQGKSASFALIPQTSTVAGKKTVFFCRVRLDDVSLGGFIAGLMPVTTTAFAPADGVYFTKATGAANNLSLVSRVGGVSTTLAIPTAAYTLVNATDIDLAFEVTTKGDIKAFVGTGLAGYQPQAGTGSTTPTRGPVALISAPTLTAVNLTPTLGLQAGSGVARTMNADFMLASRER